MIEIQGNEITIALRALSRPPYAHENLLSVLQAARSSGHRVTVSPHTLDTLREAVETGAKSGLFTDKELPEVKRFFALKLAEGRKESGPPTVAIPSPEKVRSMWPWKGQRSHTNHEGKP